jgi:hypothetical protein
VTRLRSIVLCALVALGLSGSAWAQVQNRAVTLLPVTTIGAAGTYLAPDVVRVPFGTKAAAIESAFIRAAGGTSCKVFLQTSFDNGATWVDIAQHAFLTTTASKVSAVRLDIALAGGYTPTDGTLADDTIKDGLLGDRLRVKFIVAGTYTGASSVASTVVLN